MALSRRTRRALQLCWLVLIAGMFLSRCLTRWAPSVSGYGSLVGVSDEAPRDAAQASQPGPAGHVRRGALRLGTWNLEWLNQPERGPHARSAAQLRQMQRFAHRLPFDVIAVQEVASLVALRGVFASESFDAHLTDGGGAQKVGFVVRRGMAWRALDDLRSLAGEHLRPGADIVVRLGDGELRLLAVHLKAGCYSRELGPAPACQKLARQAPPLEAWIDARARAGEPFGVAGDFNRQLLADGPLWRSWDDQEPAGLRLWSPTAGRRARCGARRNAHLIDHVILGGPAVDWGVDGSVQVIDHGLPAVLGDHCPVGISLALAPP